MADGGVENLMPREVAFQAENAGVIKANLDFFATLMLAVLAGAFIGFGAVFSTTVMTGNGLEGAIRLPFGLMRLIGGSVFCLGLILVVIAGAEMFTGNVLLVMAAASRKITARKLLRNWGIVFGGNFLGAMATAYLIFLTGQHLLMNGQVGLTALRIAEMKCELSFGAALTRAVFCNVLVCLAIWLSLSGRAVVDKVAVILFPITAFVTAGFEHSVANMYFISAALFIKQGAAPEFWQGLGVTAEQFGALNWSRFLWGNLLPVTLGNTIGGLAVGLMYWAIYCRPNIMNTGRQKDLLKQLTQDGRRRIRRIEAEGMVTMHFEDHVFHGHLRNFTHEGMMAEFYEAAGLPQVGDAVVLEIEASGLDKGIGDLHGALVNSNRKKNLMGRGYFVFNISITGPAGSTAALKRLGEQLSPRLPP